MSTVSEKMDRVSIRDENGHFLRWESGTGYSPAYDHFNDSHEMHQFYRKYQARLGHMYYSTGGHGIPKYECRLFLSKLGCNLLIPSFIFLTEQTAKSLDNALFNGYYAKKYHSAHKICLEEYELKVIKSNEVAATHAFCLLMARNFQSLLSNLEHNTEYADEISSVGSTFDPHRIWKGNVRKPSFYEELYEYSLLRAEFLITSHSQTFKDERATVRSIIDLYSAPKGPDGRPKKRLLEPLAIVQEKNILDLGRSVYSDNLAA